MIHRLTAAEGAAFERATRAVKPKPDGGLAGGRGLARGARTAAAGGLRTRARGRGR